eukprot:XP_001704266.1 Hypothetical protein GL50803_115363 [Giardia lamblia ATCC 50803]
MSGTVLWTQRRCLVQVDDRRERMAPADAYGQLVTQY